MALGAQETPTWKKDRSRTLKAQAEEAGWLDRSTRRPLPRPPRVVGLITRERSKARADVIGSLKDASIQAEVVFEPAPMQGPEIVEGIKSALASPWSPPSAIAVTSHWPTMQPIGWRRRRRRSDRCWRDEDRSRGNRCWQSDQWWQGDRHQQRNRRNKGKLSW